MKKRLYIIATIVLVTLFSFQTLKSSTQGPSVETPEIEEELTAINYKAGDNFKDFDALTD